MPGGGHHGGPAGVGNGGHPYFLDRCTESTGAVSIGDSYVPHRFYPPVAVMGIAWGDRGRVGARRWHRVPAQVGSHRCTGQPSPAPITVAHDHRRTDESCWSNRLGNDPATRRLRPPFFRLGQRFSGAGGDAVGRDVSRVEGSSTPVDLLSGIGLGLQPLEDALPGPVARPAVIAGLPGPITGQNVSPKPPGLQAPQNPVKNGPVIDKGMASVGIGRQIGEQCLLGQYINSLARPERFERPTPWFVAKYSIQLSYGRACKAYNKKARSLLAGSNAYYVLTNFQKLIQNRTKFLFLWWAAQGSNL
jgi:hypothetical protein